MKVTLRRAFSKEDIGDTSYSVQFDGHYYAMGLDIRGSFSPTDADEHRVSVMNRIIRQTSPKWKQIRDDEDGSIEEAEVEITDRDIQTIVAMSADSWRPIEG